MCRYPWPSGVSPLPQVRWRTSSCGTPCPDEAFCAAITCNLGTSIANVGLPSLAHAFAASFHAVQWVVLAYLLAITAVIVSAGRLGDYLGRRRLLLAGLLLFALACAGCAASPSSVCHWLGWRPPSPSAICRWMLAALTRQSGIHSGRPCAMWGCAPGWQ
ncbi:MFS transporter [Pseudomonas synxantha]|uniref:MFS transporter n=1 Tax=Pseudomonas synxantha TaxID=47883 RepID=UPI003D17C074